MTMTNIHEAKTHLSRLVDRAAKGEEIIIAKAGTPVAKLVGYTQSTKPRKGGQWRGRVRIGKDFDAPLPDDIAHALGIK